MPQPLLDVFAVRMLYASSKQPPIGISVSLPASCRPIAPALRYRDEQLPPPQRVLIFQPLLAAECGVERAGDFSGPGRNHTPVEVKVGSESATA